MQFIQIFKNLGIIVLGIIWIIWRILSERMSSYRAKFIANNFKIVAALEKVTSIKMVSQQQYGKERAAPLTKVSSFVNKKVV